MSGIEILGVAASVLQIAELGGQLSVKLFTFSRKIKNADKNIDRISKDIAATGAVLQQLGKELERDTELRLCSSEAVVTAKSLVNDCNNVFLELDQALSNRTSVGNGTSYKLVTGWRSRLKYPFLEAHVEMLRSNLERLKSSLLVMLNVLIFAEQLRNRDTLPASVLKDQRELLNALDEEKRANDARFGKVVKALENFQVDESMRAAANAHLAQQNVILQANQAIPASQSSGKDLWTMYSVPDDVPRLPPALSYREKEIRHHCALVTRLVQEVSAVQYEIGHGLRDRMQKGVLGIHWKEWSSLRKQCGDEELLGLFSSHPDVVHFWRTQMEEDWRPEDYTAMQMPTHRSSISCSPSVADMYSDMASPLVRSTMGGWESLVMPHETQGFVYTGTLLRHQRQVHQQTIGERIFCPYPDCNRSTDRGFTREEILNEHIRRLHHIQIPSVNDASARATARLNVPKSAEPDILAGKHPTEPADSTGEVDQDNLMNTGHSSYHLADITSDPMLKFYTGNRQEQVMPYAGSGRGRKRSRGPELEGDETRQRCSGEPKGRLQGKRPSESRKVPRWESDVGSPGSWDRVDQIMMSMTTMSKEEILSSH